MNRSVPSDRSASGLHPWVEHTTDPTWRFDCLDRSGGARTLFFIDAVDEVIARSLDEVLPALAKIERFVAAGGHAAGYIAYEAAPAFEPALECHPSAQNFPLLFFRLFQQRIEEESSLFSAARRPDYELGAFQPALGFAEYGARVEMIAKRIRAGEVDQVNLTFPLHASFRGSPLALYHDLARAQQAEFCAYLPIREQVLVSASPELFFRLRDREIELRPMKGTRPRGRWIEEDEALAADLATSEKDRAENLLTVEIMRADLERIAEPGSIDLSALLEVERYPTVHQLTSTLRGRLAPEVGMVEILQALFPSGSITGAPKGRAAQLIRELEMMPRGPYTGAIGYWGPGEALFSVAIRTARVDLREERLELGVGSGITRQSIPAAEYQECLDKSVFARHPRPDFELLESIRLDLESGYFLLEEHLRRMAGSARYFGFRLDLGEVRNALDQLLTRLRAHDKESRAEIDRLHPQILKVRLLLSSRSAVRLEHHPVEESGRVMRLEVSSTSVDKLDPFLYHKTTHRKVYQEALAAHPGADDVILQNRKGELTEMTTGNLVLQLDGRLVTPPLESGILPGLMRARLLEKGTLALRTLTREDLERASAIYNINSVRGWRTGLLVDNGVAGSGAPVLSGRLTRGEE